MSPAKKLWWVIIALSILAAAVYTGGQVWIQPFEDRGQSQLEPGVVTADPVMNPQDAFWVQFGRG